jgi:hypothetical protein
MCGASLYSGPKMAWGVRREPGFLKIVLSIHTLSALAFDEPAGHIFK